MKHDPGEWNRWCVLAMLCEGPLNMDGLSVGLGGGLCRAVAEEEEMITSGPAFRRLEANRPRGALELDYWWPHTRAGWDARARFCWRMAAECEAEESR